MRHFDLSEEDWLVLCDLLTGWCAPGAVPPAGLVEQLQRAPSVEDERVEYRLQQTSSVGEWMRCGTWSDPDLARDRLVWYRGRAPLSLGVSPERAPKFRVVERRITETPLDW